LKARYSSSNNLREANLANKYLMTGGKLTILVADRDRERDDLKRFPNPLGVAYLGTEPCQLSKGVG
jgi:hypothetical protein